MSITFQIVHNNEVSGREKSKGKSGKRVEGLYEERGRG
jgi:hypothetical protein